MSALRPYQMRAVEAVKASWRAGHRRIVIVLPTGGGKTAIAVSVVAGGIAKGRRVLWLTHRRELIEQASRRLSSVGLHRHGVILAGHGRRDPSLPVQVASIQTLVARPDELPPADILVIDECHHAVARTWSALKARYPRTELTLGLTATPERGDRQPLGAEFDDLVVASSVAELTAAGWLVPCDVIGPAKYLDRGLAMPALDAVLSYRGRRTVVFCGTVPEARSLAADLRARGVAAACVDGELDEDTREQSLRAFEAGTLTVLTNVYVLTEGWDAPGTEVCVLARGCSSATTYLQMVGRVLRPAPGKARAILHDLRGVVHLHGLPDAERAYSLHGEAIALVDKPALRQCAACGAVFRPGPSSCPRCGAKLAPIRERRTRIERAETRLLTSADVVPMGDRRRYFDQLVAVAAARGWKPGAIGIRYKARFGQWPPWTIPGLRRGAA